MVVQGVQCMCFRRVPWVQGVQSEG